MISSHHFSTARKQVVATPSYGLRSTALPVLVPCVTVTGIFYSLARASTIPRLV
jgi:hypothetical protein